MTTVTSSSTETGNAILAQLNGQYDGTIDVTTVVESLLFAETGVEINSITSAIESAKTKQTAFQLLETALNGFSSIMDQLSTSFQNVGKSAVFADSSVADVYIQGDVASGSYTFESLNLASKQSVTSQEYANGSSLVGSGTMTIETGAYGVGFSGNGDAVDINVLAGTTVDELISQINSSGPGITAYAVNTATGVQIAMTSASTGEVNGFSVSVADSDGDSADGFGLSALQYNATTQNQALGQSAKDAQVLFDGVVLRSSSNQFNNVIQGFNFDLKSVNVGSPTVLNVADDVDGAKALLEEFILSYNSVIEIFDYLSDTTEGEDSQGVLFRDSDLRLLEKDFRSIAESAVSGYGGNAFLNDLGVRFSAERSYMLELDESIFNTKMSSDPDAVKNVLAQVAIPSDSRVTFISAESYTLAGSYDPIDVTVLPDSPKLTGGLASSLIVDGATGGFSITVNGESTGQLLLENKTYASYDEMALELQKKINASLDTGTVNVVYDGSGFVIDNGVTGSASVITIDSSDAGFAAVTGLTSGLSQSGVDIQASVGGGVAIGTGSVLEVITGDAAGLSIQVDADVLGSYGSIDLSDGIALQLSQYVSDSFGENGLFKGILEKFDSNITDKEERLSELEDRTEVLKVKYSIKYSAINNFIIAMQQTSAQLQAQFDSWNEG